MVGSGAREHALVWKLIQEAEVFVAGGNPGISGLAECHQSTPYGGLLGLVKHVEPNLVVFGPEGPLIEGEADTLREAGFRVFGPGGVGAELEASKAFSKRIMHEAGVPTADFSTFDNSREAADYAKRLFDQGSSAVIKASGAALGKGVVVCSTYEESEQAIQRMIDHEEFGAAGSTVVVEQRLVGREFSLLTLCSAGANGIFTQSLPIAQDYKRVMDGDKGPNTGGMGSYCPVGWITDEIKQQTEEQIVRPLLQHLVNVGIEYRGVLFSGVMVQDGKAFCLEYNVRFGDPETQSIIRRVHSGFLEALTNAADGLPMPEVTITDEAAVAVVLASEGYPGTYEKGAPIVIQEVEQGVELFHGGTKEIDGKLVTSGGRVITLTATGNDVSEARDKAYRNVSRVQFEGMQMRTDIAKPWPADDGVY